MKYLLILLIFCAKISFAQSFYYPVLNKQAKNLEAIIPEKWKVIDTAYGDLNGDKVEDLAFVLEYNLPVNERRAYGDNESDLIKEFQRPRVLAVYFKDRKGGKYIFAMQNNNFMLRANEGGALGDPLKNINIVNNRLILAFEGGANWRWKLNYEFKYTNKDWNLVNANNFYYNASSGEMTDRQYNFLDRKLRMVFGNVANTTNEVREETLIFGSFKNLTTFKKPWTWEIMKDNFL